MHNNFYFLRQLSVRLSQFLPGGQLETCFSQNKDELIIGFALSESDFYIKAHFLSDFCCLFFPQDFHRSRRNSIDLFTELSSKTVSAVRQYENERCFGILFEEDYELLFKMHGNRANIVLFQRGEFVSMFKNKLHNDKELQPDRLDRSLPYGEEVLNSKEGDYSSLFPTFGKVVKRYLQQQTYEEKGIEAKWKLLQEVEAQLLTPEYTITEIANQITFSLLPLGTIRRSHMDPITAINDFFLTYSSEQQLYKEKSVLLGGLQKALKQTKNYLLKTGRKLQEIKDGTGYEVWANVLMANLHQVPAQAERVELFNFYDDSTISIPLKRKLSPQKNAEVFYRKSKNQKLEIQQLEKVLSQKELQALQWEEHIEAIEAIDHLKNLRAYVKEHRLGKKNEVAQSAPKPYTEFIIDGYSVWVGRNAKHNDELTLKHAWKEDLWLHAKDVSGSHVVIKQQSGKTTPKNVIEKAAALAAYYSKRKTDTLCPVIVTPKKYVRKRKGDPAGAVIVEKEDVILVKPSKPGQLS